MYCRIGFCTLRNSVSDLFLCVPSLYFCFQEHAECEPSVPFSCFQEFAFWVYSCCFSWVWSAGYGLVFAICFQTRVWTLLCSTSAFPRGFWIAHILWRIFLRTQLIVRHQCNTYRLRQFTHLGFAIAELSPEVPSCPLFDLALSTRCFLTERHKRLQEIIGRFIMFNQWRRWFHSSRVKLPLVNVCKLVLGVNVFDLDSWVQDDSVKQPINCNSVGSWHVSHCWTCAFDNHFDNSPWDECASVRT